MSTGSQQRSGNPGVRNCQHPRLAFLLGMTSPIIITAVASTYDYYRKRAKTEDEKEQRRIERVLRNRQAAQSSRERKRQEVEKLEGEKQSIEEQNESLKQRLMKVEHEKFLLGQQVAKLAAQMKAFQRGKSMPHVQLSPPLEPDLLEHDQIIKQELDENPFALPTPQQSLYATSTSYSSPSTATYSSSSTPATIDLGVDDLTASPDMTQHPAAMLCDLPCQSQEITQSLQTSAPVMFFWMLILLATLAISFCQQTMLIPRPFTPISSCLLCLLISMTIQWTPWSKTLLDFSRHLTSTWNMIMSPPTEQITTLPKFWRRAAILMRPLSA